MEPCLRNWLKSADVEVEIRTGTARQESEELRELKERIRLVAQVNKVLRRAACLSQAILRLGQFQNEPPAGP